MPCSKKQASIAIIVAQIRHAAKIIVGKPVAKNRGSMSAKTSLLEVAENMAEAIREWNRAKMERESWKPVVGQVPPVGILGNAKKANAMLSKALEDYETFQHRLQQDGLLPCGHGKEYQAIRVSDGKSVCAMCERQAAAHT
jgi:hypothetical protein